MQVDKLENLTLLIELITSLKYLFVIQQHVLSAYVEFIIKQNKNPCCEVYILAEKGPL